MAQTSTTENLTTETLKKKLFDSVMQQEWEKVATIYKEYPSAQTIKIKSSGETALHLAISDPKYEKNVENAKKLVGHIKENGLEVLNLETEKGDTPLHSAAATSRAGKLCKLLIEKVGGVKKEYALKLVSNRCKKGETPLFKAVHYGRLGSFFYLHSIMANTGKDFSNFERNDGQSILDDSIWSILVRKDDGQSILHEAIIREHFDLAFYIIQLYKGLVNLVDHQGDSPLHALSKKAAAFKSGSSLHWWDKLIYNCICVEELKRLHEKSDEENNTMDNGVEKECTNIDIKSGEGSDFPPEIERRLKQSRETSRIWYCFVIFGYGRKAFDKIYKEKLKHTRAKQVLDELLKHATMYDENTTAQSQDEDSEDVSDKSSRVELSSSISKSSRVVLSSSSGTNAGGKDVFQSSREEPSSSSGAGKDESSKQKDTALLIAAKHGIVEMVKQITDKFPVAINDEDKYGNNVLLLAVENRHLKLCKHLIDTYPPKKSVIYQKEQNEGDTALHLAAIYDEEHTRVWPVPGAALQMVWEVKWNEFMEDTMPSSLFLRTNKTGKTPRDIFSTTHKGLIKDGMEWLQGMATSCSVVAALIVTIAFNSSTTVPGGTDSNIGKPILRNNSAFNIFAIASLIALCFSVTALITFLAILTSRFHERDFGKNLPWKILIGLTSLFGSIAAMLITFCAGRFLVFEEKIKYAAFPIYAVTFIPLFLFAVAQFPLYFDLARAIFFSPFHYDFSLKKMKKKVKEVLKVLKVGRSE